MRAPWRCRTRCAKPAHAAVVRLLSRIGRNKEALSHYERARRIFETELGAPPSDELEEARQALQSVADARASVEPSRARPGQFAGVRPPARQRPLSCRPRCRACADPAHRGGDSEKASIGCAAGDGRGRDRQEPSPGMHRRTHDFRRRRRLERPRLRARSGPPLWDLVRYSASDRPRATARRTPARISACCFPKSARRPIRGSEPTVRCRRRSAPASCLGTGGGDHPRRHPMDRRGVLLAAPLRRAPYRRRFGPAHRLRRSRGRDRGQRGGIERIALACPREAASEDRAQSPGP